jgi:hypothetical protein
MSTNKSALGILLLVLLPLLIVMMTGFATPADAQTRALYGITPTVGVPTDTPEPPTDTPEPPTDTPEPPTNTPRPPEPTSRPQTPAPPPAETPVPLLPATGAEQLTNLLLPAILVLAVLASLTCVVAIRRVRLQETCCDIQLEKE